MTRVFWQAISYLFFILAFLLNLSILVACKTIIGLQICQQVLNSVSIKLRFSILDSNDLCFFSQKNTLCKHVLLYVDFRIKVKKKGEAVTASRTPVFESHASAIPSAADSATSPCSFITSVIPNWYQ